MKLLALSENHIVVVGFAFLIGITVGTWLLYTLIKAAARNGTKEALKQSEYYLESIAKHYHEKK